MESGDSDSDSIPITYTDKVLNDVVLCATKMQSIERDCSLANVILKMGLHIGSLRLTQYETIIKCNLLLQVIENDSFIPLNL